MRFLDLTHTLHPNVPTWDGDCGFRASIEADYSTGCLIKRYDCVAGTGTHIDAPLHFFPKGKDLASLQLDSFIGPVANIDVTSKMHSEYFLSVEDILENEKKFGELEPGSFVFAYTGWGKYWSEPSRYRNNLRFPGFSLEAAELLIEKKIIGIGLDTLSPDGSNTAFPVHHLILGAGKTIIENLATLNQLPARGATVFALPPKIQKGAEAPVRVVAVLNFNVQELLDQKIKKN